MAGTVPNYKNKKCLQHTFLGVLKIQKDILGTLQKKLSIDCMIIILEVTNGLEKMDHLL